MFLRVKKKTMKHGQISYHFSLVENHREDGKVKQKVIKYLSSFTDEYYSAYSMGEQREKRDESSKRLFFWFNVHQDLKDLKLDKEKEKKIVLKIKSYLSIPLYEDLDIWIEWRRSCLAYFKRTEEEMKQFEDYINRVKALYNEMRSDYRYALGDAAVVTTNDE